MWRSNTYYNTTRVRRKTTYMSIVDALRKVRNHKFNAFELIMIPEAYKFDSTQSAIANTLRFYFNKGHAFAVASSAPCIEM